jgi:proline iminopeptidase
MLHASEGYIPVDGGRVWYQIVGGGESIPLLCLHGGPGFCHDYLETLADLSDERPVIFYDQLGCGNSERPDDRSLWIAERSLVEVSQVRRALGLERVHVLGQSWGSMLLVDYILTKPRGVVSLILASPCTSIPMWLADANRLRRQLPAEIQAILDRHEAAGTTNSAEYQWATNEYYKRHLCRLEPWPMAMQRTMAKAGYPVYNTMWGPSEFNMSGGNLRYYDRAARLHEIDLSTLWTCGRYDEAQPETVAYYQSLLPGSELVIFEESSHTAHLEERRRYMGTIREFLRRVERIQ